MKTPSPPDEDRSGAVQDGTPLVAVLRDEITREGPITFARFMEQALYHPRYGYYRVAATRPGRSGDFLTAPEAHPIFGHALARQLDEMWRLLGEPERFTLREYGAGAGTLVLAILDGLRADGSPLLERLRYQPVEINPYRLTELRAALAAAGYDAAPAAGQLDEPFTGCALANEFVDAFPVHRVIIANGAARESYVGWSDAGFVEVLGPLSDPALGARLEALRAAGITLAEGQRLELNLQADAWVAELSRALERGYALVIDYGYPAAQLYAPERAGGTLKAYTEHTVHEDLYAAPGEQDLTAHVDFSALEAAARRHGLTPLGLTTQAEFLNGAGIGALLVELQSRPGMTFAAYVAARSAVFRMIDPGAMGRFRVLALGKDVPATPLRGFSTPLL